MVNWLQKRIVSSGVSTLSINEVKAVKYESRIIWVLSRDELRRVDADAVREFGIPSIVLMENAARALATESLRLMRTCTVDGRGAVLVMCGAGNNGGDGYAAARHLHNAGCDVTLVVLNKPRPDSDAAVNANICRKMNLQTATVENFPSAARRADVVVDAIFGTGLDRDVTGQAAHVIALLNEMQKPVVAADVPSGLDCETGRVLGEAVRARVTVKFVALTPGMLRPEAQSTLGEIVIAGIGVPVELVASLGTRIDSEALDSLAHPLRFADLAV